MIIFGSPARYVQGAGALDRIGLELRRIAPRAILLADPFVDENYAKIIAASCSAAEVDLRVLRFGGESSPDELERLAALASPFEPLLIAAAGGGKCIDAGKALAAYFDVPVATVPTVASTDAPTSHNYVLYDEDHRLLRVEKLRRNPELVLVDTSVIARAPRQFFLAGIGDAIGKSFEVEQCVASRGVNVFSGRPARSALILARACHEILRSDGVAALASLERGEADEAVERVVEATVLMSGLAFESGGLSIAHSMTRGLTAVTPWKEKLHGFQVAYANLVQIVLEGRDAGFVDDLIGYYRTIGLPVTLEELGGARPDTEIFETIARLTLTAPHVHHFPRRLEAQDIVAAMQILEQRHTVKA